MTSDDEALFVIAATVRQGEPLSYANHNGDLVSLGGAQTFAHGAAIEKAREATVALGRAVWVAPLLFGIPDMDSAEWFSPEGEGHV